MRGWGGTGGPGDLHPVANLAGVVTSRAAGRSDLDSVGSEVA